MAPPGALVTAGGAAQQAAASKAVPCAAAVRPRKRARRPPPSPSGTAAAAASARRGGAGALPLHPSARALLREEAAGPEEAQEEEEEGPCCHPSDPHRRGGPLGLRLDGFFGETAPAGAGEGLLERLFGTPAPTGIEVAGRHATGFIVNSAFLERLNAKIGRLVEENARLKLRLGGSGGA